MIIVTCVYFHPQLAVTSCMSDSGLVWYCIWLVYSILLVVILLLLAYQNSRIPSRFKAEGEAAFKALLVILLIHPFLVITYIGLVVEYLYLPAYWVTVANSCVFPALVLSVISIPKVSLFEYNSSRYYIPTGVHELPNAAKKHPAV